MKTLSTFLFESEQIKTFDLILENLQQAKKNFLAKDLIDQKTFNDLTNIDPSKTKKYVFQICKFHLEGADIEELKDLVSEYDRLVEKNLTKQKDIQKFKTYLEFKTFVEKEKPKTSKTQQLKQVKEKDVEVIMNTDRFLILKPKTHSASCIYGAGTKWCITEKSPQHWDAYYGDKFVEFYFILDKDKPETDPFYKMAVSVYPDGQKECFDSEDKKFDFSYVLKTLKLDEKIFSSADNIFKRQLKSWIKGTYEIEDGLINVKGDVGISNWKEDRLPVRFGIVTGDFDCSWNKLVSLEGAPEEVGGDFDCQNNHLVSLKGAPQKVRKDFVCKENQIVSLEGAPKKVGGDFYCQYNKLVSLVGAPLKVKRSFDCSNNRLVSLAGVPEIMEGKFDCSYNRLVTLAGALQEVRGDFFCHNNQLVSLEGSPKEVGGSFWCNDNNLVSLEGAPKVVKGDFICYNNKTKFTEEDVRKISNVKWGISV